MIGTVGAYWLEQTAADVPSRNDWLSAGEMSVLAGLRFENRRTDWRLGRWTAKRAVASCLHLAVDVHSLEDIEIRAAPSGVPEVFLFNLRSPVRISLSHRAGNALCFVGLSGANLGCDLELVESRDHSFVTDFFTANEQRFIGQAPPQQQALLTTLLWSAKESALKALHVGLRLDTTSLEVSPSRAITQRPFGPDPSACASWSPLFIRRIGGSMLEGWWRCVNKMVRTVVFDPLR